MIINLLFSGFLFLVLLCSNCSPVHSDLFLAFAVVVVHYLASSCSSLLRFGEDGDDARYFTTRSYLLYDKVQSIQQIL